MKTPFNRSGFTDETKFRLLLDIYPLKKGDIVKIKRDDGSRMPIFSTGEGVSAFLIIPGMSSECGSHHETLEECKEESK